MNKKNKAILVVMALFLFSGCIQKLTVKDITPNFPKSAPVKIKLSVIDNRPYVLSGSRSEKFVGVYRTLGIPYSIEQPNVESFALHLASIMKTGFTTSGSVVTVTVAPMGGDVSKIAKSLSVARGEKGVVVVVNDSRCDGGGRARFSYYYDFDIYIVGPKGKVLARKTFAGKQNSSKQVNYARYVVYDMHSIIYKQNFEKMFNHPVIKKKLFY